VPRKFKTHNIVLHHKHKTKCSNPLQVTNNVKMMKCTLELLIINKLFSTGNYWGVEDMGLRNEEMNYN